MFEERPDRRGSDPESTSRSQGADRRDSPRLLMPFQIRVSEDEPFVDCEGDLSLGGACYRAEAPPIPDRVDVRIHLPPTASHASAEIRCRASVVRTQREDSGLWGVHLAFRDMALEDERILARFFDDHLLSRRGER
ncbi:MAG: PilZ domain-containing protein [Myxococcaceae bacterium]|nr:PilZ domain-containing protein [Myxococcaceae bacterium]